MTKLVRYFSAFSRMYHGTSSATMGNKQRQIDLRSDTVTRPSKGMLESMMGAKVGDDVYKEDPTVNRLEEKCAQLFGMEGALFVPTGTMGNLLAIMSHIEGRGQELIIGADQHVYIYEQVHFAQVAGIPSRVLPNQADGTILIDDIKRHIFDASDFHICETRLICLENSHMRCGGLPLPSDYVKSVSTIALANSIKLHVDGARIYNAAVSHGVPLRNLLQGVDSVSMCLSKGLGCPVGSVIGGSKDLINKAMRNRKMLGGGMRQAGILAAAGLYALQHAEEQLRKDHVKTRKLADGIDSLKSDLFSVDINRVKTNILFITTPNNMASEIVRRLKEKNILCSAFSPSTVRLVTHLDISFTDVDETIDAFGNIKNTL